MVAARRKRRCRAGAPLRALRTVDGRAGTSFYDERGSTSRGRADSRETLAATERDQVARRGLRERLRARCKTCPRSDATLLDIAKELVTDEVWEIIEPLLPPEPPKPRGGRPRVPDRAALTGIVFVLRTGIR
jgi:hypothetical protein